MEAAAAEAAAVEVEAVAAEAVAAEAVAVSRRRLQVLMAHRLLARQRWAAETTLWRQQPYPAIAAILQQANQASVD